MPSRLHHLGVDLVASQRPAQRLAHAEILSPRSFESLERSDNSSAFPQVACSSVQLSTIPYGGFGSGEFVGAASISNSSTSRRSPGSVTRW
jgi:hypothetical protein